MQAVFFAGYRKGQIKFCGRSCDKLHFSSPSSKSRVTTNSVVKFSIGSFASSMFPPCIVTIFLHTASPNPEPCLLRDFSPTTNASKTSALDSSFMPGPLSASEILALFPSLSTPKRSVEPCGVYLKKFPVRFSNTRKSCPLSTLHTSGSSQICASRI